jgi:glutathione S-transferase
MTSTALPLLYSYRRCPYAMRARMALLVAGQAFEAVEISLRDKPAQMLAVSPKGTVPVLLLTHGEVLAESWDIMRWALQPLVETDVKAGWWQRAQSPENLALLQANDGPFKRLLDRYKYPERYADEGLNRDEVHAQAVAAALAPLEARLQTQPFLGDDAPCATDLALFPFVRQFAAVEPTRFAALPLPGLQAWLARWLGSRLFQACMVKLPAQQKVVFPGLQGEGMF